MSRRAKYLSIAHDALCATTIKGSLVDPEYVHIRLAGTIAHVPSLKNQKIQGTNILRHDVKAVLDAMTRAFERSVEFAPPRFSKTMEIFMLVDFAHRRNSFDKDNALTTIQDWLEPKHIRGKDRGWGIGVVPNDKMISSFATRKKKDHTSAGITDIYIRRLADVRDDLDEMMLEVTRPMRENLH